MKSPVLYLLEVLFCSGMLMAFYRLLVMRKVAFVHCRRYLVVAVVLSLMIPALDIPVYPARTVVYPVPVIAAQERVPVLSESLEVADAPTLPMEPIAGAEAPIDWPHVARVVVAGLYLLTVAVSLGLFVAHLMAIRRLRRRSRLTDCGEYTLAENPAVRTPFSFLRTVFLGDGYEGRRRDIVLCHEVSHVRHRHSAERIAIELIRCVVWFNPFVWMASRWLQEVQEWEADRDVLDAGYDLTEYRTIIFRQLFGYNPDIACGLNHSLTKNRFAMMTHTKVRRLTLLRFAAVVPVLAGMMMLCSFTTRTPEPPSGAAAVAASVQPAIPGLENLKPLPVHIWMTVTNLPASGKTNKLEYIQYLPVDNAKYLYTGNVTVTDLKGKDITWWAQKHYFVKATNPVFIIDGERMDKEAYADWSEKRMQRNREKGIKSTPAGYSDWIYTGPEVGKLLGDPTVDALVVIVTGEQVSAAAASATPRFYSPLRSEQVGAFGAQAPITDHKHTGVDLRAAKGAAVAAAADGVVTSAGADGNWGNCVRITHDGGYSSMYAHLDRIDVKNGERVRGGQTIGTVGMTGLATGPHLHFELAKDGQTFDPARIFDFSKGTTRAADARVAEVRVGKNGAVTFNGQTADSKQLPDLIASWRGGLADPKTAHIVLRAEEPAPGNDFFDMIRVNWKGSSTFDFDGKGSGVVRGDIDVTFRDKPDESLTCDSLRVDWNNRSIECFGNVVYKTPQAVFTSNYCKASVDAAGNPQWSMPRMSGIVGEHMLIQIANDKTIRVNGAPATLEQVYAEAEAFRKRTNGAEAVVVIQADPEAKMGVVTDVKQELRKAGALRVSYSLTNGLEPVSRPLPPLPMKVDDGAKSGVKVFPTEDIAIKERNLFLVLISGSGAMMAGQPGRQEIIPVDRLTGLVTTFVGNADAKSNMPEVKSEEFTLPDGRQATWPVNFGIVSLQTARDTPYAAYLDAQRQISQAFMNVREDVAQKWFGRAYSALSEAEKAIVAQAVPLRIFESEPRNIARKK